MPKPVVARALPDYRIWVRYDDGAEGAVDLSDLAGHGVFRAWADPAVFASVRIGPTGAEGRWFRESSALGLYGEQSEQLPDGGCDNVEFGSRWTIGSPANVSSCSPVANGRDRPPDFVHILNVLR